MIKPKENYYVEHNFDEKKLILSFAEEERITQLMSEVDQIIVQLNMFLTRSSNYYVDIKMKSKEIEQKTAVLLKELKSEEVALAEAENEFQKLNKKKKTK